LPREFPFTFVDFLFPIREASGADAESDAHAASLLVWRLA